jgi:hypothetical protein
MNRLFFRMLLLLLLGIWATGCINDGKQATPTAPKEVQATEVPMGQSLTQITWDETSRDLGKVVEGQRIEVVFRFTNTGSKPLVIQNVSASCGCTVPERPSEPIMPGKKGYIKGVFNSQGFPGVNHKTIFVDANTEGSTRHNLEFTIEVTPKA